MRSIVPESAAVPASPVSCQVPEAVTARSAFSARTSLSVSSKGKGVPEVPAVSAPRQLTVPVSLSNSKTGSA